MHITTRFDEIRDCHSSETLSHYLCDQIGDCEKCPVAGLCYINGTLINGFKRWLDKEVKEDDRD